MNTASVSPRKTRTSERLGPELAESDRTDAAKPDVWPPGLNGFGKKYITACLVGLSTSCFRSPIPKTSRYNNPAKKLVDKEESDLHTSGKIGSFTITPISVLFARDMDGGGGRQFSSSSAPPLDIDLLPAVKTQF